MITKLTVKQYAELTGIKKITLLKRIENKTKLQGVRKIEKGIGDYNPAIILHVDTIKAVEQNNNPKQIAAKE